MKPERMGVISIEEQMMAELRDNLPSLVVLCCQAPCTPEDWKLVQGCVIAMTAHLMLGLSSDDMDKMSDDLRKAVDSLHDDDE